MTDKRLDLLVCWLNNIFDNEHFTITNASNDASFRRYFRIEHNNISFIAMDAPPEKENSKVFVEISALLRAHNVHSPKVIETNLAQGFLLLEDLGSVTFLQALNQDNRIKLYKNAIDELIKIQNINCKNNNFSLYDDVLLKAEMQLLIDWYLPKNINNERLDKLHFIFQLLSDNAFNAPQVFVHRDYHARNLMLMQDDLCVIDFQDAVVGSNSYDLCALLKDAYFELSTIEIQMLLHYYHKQANIQTKFSQFERQFDLMGLQRHLKILGIFKRLSIRDGKNQYLDDIPLVKKYALQMADKYSEFRLLKILL